MVANSQYLAPEIKYFHQYLNGLSFDKCDIYSLGMCLMENLMGSSYRHLSHKAMMKQAERHLQSYSPALMKTLMRMIKLDPSKRPSAIELCDLGFYEESKDKLKEFKRRYSF